MQFSTHLIIFGAAFASWIIGALSALFSGRKSNNVLYAAYLLFGSVLLLVGVVLAWPHDTVWTAPFPIYLGLAPMVDHLDPLSSIFLVLLAVLSIAVAIFSPSYLSHLKDRVHVGFLWSCLLLFVLSMAQVILSANALTFLVFWEVMALSSVALVAADHVKHQSQRAAIIYLAATRISTAFLTGGFLWFYCIFKSWNFVDWNMGLHHGTWPLLLVVIGLCIKAGVWPFHIWLPYAHPAAPSPVSALMSGIMVKVPIYALIRFVLMDAASSIWLSYLLLFLGTVSSFWGVLFALVQHDLKKLLAYSTVENIGLILMGIGLSFYCKSSGLNIVASLALAAAIFHAFNHGLFKGLLFLNAGAIDSQAHTRDLTNLGGLIKNMPATSACFILGAAAISSLPPLNGFASKWLLYQSLFQTACWFKSPVTSCVALLLIGVLALVSGLALACFTKAVGASLLGRPRAHIAQDAVEASRSIVFSQVFLAVCCVALGLGAPYVVAFIQPISFASLHVSYPLVAQYTLPLPIIAISLFVMTFVAFLIFRPGLRAKKYMTWECGYGKVTPRTQISATSFSEPIAVIFRFILQASQSSAIGGSDKRHFPESIDIHEYMVPFLEAKLYRPAFNLFQSLANMLSNLQTASIHFHLFYLFLTLLILVSIGIVL